MLPLAVDGLVKAECACGEDEEETQRFREMATEARQYLASHAWCAGVADLYFAGGVPAVVAAFAARIDPRDGADEWLWIVVGDLPSAYLVIEDGPQSLPEVLETYCDLMSDWVNAIRTGHSVAKVFPVRAPADLQHAEMLERRISFLRGEVIPAFAGQPGTA